MTSKKPTRAKPYSRRTPSQQLAMQEKQAGNIETRSAGKSKRETIPKLVAFIAGLLALAIVSVVGVLQAQQLDIINGNKQDFVEIRKILKDVEESDNFSISGVEWVRGEQCEYSPGKFDLTYEARTKWRCWVAIERETGDYENLEHLLEQLIDVLDARIEGSRDSETTLSTSGGLSCYARLFTLDKSNSDNNPLMGVRLNCSGSAYESWYPNNGQWSMVEGSDAWRSLDEE